MSSTDTKATMSKNLGDEVELVSGYQFSKKVINQTDYSQMSATESMNA